MKKSSSSKSTSVSLWNNRGLLILRVVLGLVFLMHGAQKLFGVLNGPGIEGFSGFLTSLGVPLAGFFAVTIAIIEFFGGITLILGLFTRWASGLLAFNMLMAILLVHLANGFFLTVGASYVGGMEFVFVLFAGSLTLLMTGPGQWAISKKY